MPAHSNRTAIVHPLIPLRIREMIEEEGTATKVAAKLGVTKCYISNIKAGRRAPSDSVVEAMGLRRIISYERIKPPDRRNP